jgi:hypothetical protein
MNKFSAGYYMEIAVTLEWFAHKVELGHWRKDSHHHQGVDLQGVAKNVAQFLARDLASIGCKVASKTAERFASDIVLLPVNQIQVRLRELYNVITSEMADVLFLYVDSRHKEHYEGFALFGDEVEQAFPSANYDIAESGKCIALNRSTAAVCHLMRVLEWGLRAMATKLKVKFENKPWNYVIEVADKRLKHIRQSKRKPKNWKQDEKFYSEALAHFRFLKDAWRNYSMHVYERYSEEQAESIFNHTKAFMRHLATKLKQ